MTDLTEDVWSAEIQGGRAVNLISQGEQVITALNALVELQMVFVRVCGEAQWAAGRQRHTGYRQ